MNTLLAVSSVALWIVVCFNFLLTMVLIRRINQGNSKKPDALAARSLAPEFSAQRLDGTLASRPDFAGRETVFLFIAPTCEPCIKSIDEYKTTALKAKRFGVDFIFVVNSPMDEARDFVRQFNIEQPVLVAPYAENSFMKDYKVTGTPFYCFIDANGKVISVGHPSTEWGHWKQLSEAWNAPQPSAQTLIEAA